MNGYPQTKVCPHCDVLLQVKVNVTFNRKTDSIDGLQPWCRTCDHRNKRNVENGWPNFRRVLAVNNEEHIWTEAKYLQMMGAFDCWTCGAKVWEWSGGYWVDRISNKRSYIPSNCRPCCWGCNRCKSNRNPESFQLEIDRLVKQYGRGKVPWNEIHPGIEHTEDNAPDLSEWVVPSKQQRLLP